MRSVLAASMLLLACSSADDTITPDPTTTTAAASGVGGATSATGTGGAGGSSSSAATGTGGSTTGTGGNGQGAPDVAEEQCDKTIDFGGSPWLAAEHAYPGKSVGDLAMLRVQAHYTAAAGKPAGYEWVSWEVWATDGKALAACGPTTGTQVDSVRFVLPAQ